MLEQKTNRKVIYLSIAILPLVFATLMIASASSPKQGSIVEMRKTPIFIFTPVFATISPGSECKVAQPSGFSVSGYKFKDTDDDGIWDSGEPGLAGWTIELHDSAGNTHTTTTDSDGFYQFLLTPSIASGIARIGEVQQAGWEQTYPIGRGGNPSNHYIVINPCNSYPNNNFGNHRTTPNTLPQVSCTTYLEQSYPDVPGHPNCKHYSVTFTSSDSDGVIVSAVLLGTVTVGDVSPLVGVPIFTYDAGTWEPSCPGQAHSSYSFSFSVTDDEGGSATATCSVP